MHWQYLQSLLIYLNRQLILEYFLCLILIMMMTIIIVKFVVHYMQIYRSAGTSTLAREVTVISSFVIIKFNIPATLQVEEVTSSLITILL